VRTGPPSSEPSKSERTRTALREAAITRFVRDGFEATRIGDIAADVGVTTRTFYRYFAGKDEVLFTDYEDRLDWFRRALSVRPRKESLLDSVRAAVASFPDDPAVVAEIARIRTDGLDPDRIDAHIRRVEAELARAIEAHLLERAGGAAGDDRVRAAVTARAVAAAVFTALDAWMAGPADDLDELTRLTEVALAVVEPMALGGAG
jgi:AcrR family transcriptional regulator